MMTICYFIIFRCLGCLAYVCIYMGYINFDAFAIFCHLRPCLPWPNVFAFIWRLVVFYFDDHIAKPMQTYHELKKIQTSLFPCLAVGLLANSFAMTSVRCADVLVPSSVTAILPPLAPTPSRKPPFPTPALKATAFHSVLLLSVVRDPLVNHLLAKCCDHSVGLHSPVGTSFG